MSAIKIPAGKYYTTATAAVVLNKTDRRIRQLIEDGDIASIRLGPRFSLISHAELMRWKKQAKAP